MPTTYIVPFLILTFMTGEESNACDGKMSLEAVKINNFFSYIFVHFDHHHDHILLTTLVVDAFLMLVL